MFHYTTKFYHQADGRVFEHRSTLNPNPIIVEPIHTNVVTRPIAPVDIVTTEHSFTSIPLFNSCLTPTIVIWN